MEGIFVERYQTKMSQARQNFKVAHCCCRFTGGSSLRRKLTSEFVAKFGIDRAPKFLASEISRPWKRERNKESNWNMSKQLYLNKTERLGLYLNIALASLYFCTGSLWKGKPREPAQKASLSRNPWRNLVFRWVHSWRHWISSAIVKHFQPLKWLICWE